jgi:hypothetical protein
MTSHRGLLISAFLHEFQPYVNKHFWKIRSPKPFFSRDFEREGHAAPSILSLRGMGHVLRAAPFRDASTPFSFDSIVCPPTHIPGLRIPPRWKLILENLYGYFAIRADIAAIHARRIERHGNVAVLVERNHAASPAHST